mmetsp:Transcript_105243/g.294920  ORF Transcript_105243/g.294920 Transcript_105243/m.294920 type:complete len:142 (-) Transcript_105243:320-745(-)
MCSPNAEGTHHLIDRLAKEQRMPMVGNTTQPIPAGVAANISEQVGDNTLRTADELKRITSASQEAIFNEAWPWFYDCVLVPAAKAGKSSVDLEKWSCTSKCFTTFDELSLRRYLKFKGVALSETEEKVTWNCTKVWWRFSW